MSDSAAQIPKFKPGQYWRDPKIAIPIDKPILVADVACGNGAWMPDLQRQRPHAWIDGFDIAENIFPSWKELPNLRFHTWDAFTEVPEEFVGVFDVVHIRTIYSAILDNNVQPLLKNLLKMLKPDGYLQWDEQGASKLRVDLVENAQTDAQVTKTLVTFFDSMSVQMKMSPDWLHQLPSTLRKTGCQVVHEQRVAPRKELQRAWCDDFLTVWSGLAAQIPETPMPMPKVEGLPEEMSRDKYVELIQKAMEECAKGAWINCEQVVIVARKPE